MSQPWDYIAKLVCIGDSGTGKSSLTIRLCENRFSSIHDVTIGVEFGSRILPIGPPAHPLPDIPPSKSSTLGTPQKRNPISPGASSPKVASTPAKSPSRAVEPPKPPVQKHMKLSLWDTAGQETYASITRSYFRGASGALLVFDLTRRKTFEHLDPWLVDLRSIAEENIVIVLVGNKHDLATASENKSDGVSKPSTTGAPAFKPPSRQVSTEEAEAWCQRNGILRYVETSAKSGQGVEDAFVEVASKIYGNILRGQYDLNDRRSGVKGPNANPGVLRGQASTVNLKVSDAAKGGQAWSNCGCG